MYFSDNLAIVVPTKDRPEDVSRLLASISKQSAIPGLIVIVDSGGASEDNVKGYQHILPIKYFNTNIVGQIAQRNFGVLSVEKEYQLIGYMDDDIVLEIDSIKFMIEDWNRKEDETAGIGFTILNNPEYKNGFLRKLAFMGSDRPGEILQSGYNVPVAKENQNIRTNWLCGGATVWRHSVLKEFTLESINSKWAICEDIIYSYPVSKKYPLYVSLKAQVVHNDSHQEKYLNVRSIYRGKNSALWRMYFVCQHDELSLLAFSWMLACQILSRFVVGVFTIRPNPILHAIGQLYGLLSGMRVLLFRGDLLNTIREKDELPQ